MCRETIYIINSKNIADLDNLGLGEYTTAHLPFYVFISHNNYIPT